MNANRVEYHEGAAADVRQALAWYQKQNRKVTLDFLEELYRATRGGARTLADGKSRAAWPTQLSSST